MYIYTLYVNLFAKVKPTGMELRDLSPNKEANSLNIQSKGSMFSRIQIALRWLDE
jgi:hypothetical protein